MNGFTEYQNNIFNIVRDAGYVGTQEQLFDMMQQQTYFDSTFNLVRQAGFEGNERDFIFLAGVAPKKKDSALSEEYSTLLGYGVEGGGLDVPTDTTVPPIERENELSRLASQQETLQGDFFEGIFGSRTDPIDGNNLTGTGGLRPEEKDRFHEQSRLDIAEQFSAESVGEGFVATEGDLNNVDYENYHLAKKWLTSRGIELGTPVGPGDIASFSSEIYDTFRANAYIINTGTTADSFEAIIKNSGLLIEDPNSTLNVEMRKTAIVSSTFDIGTYTVDALNEVPTIDTEEGASFFYEPHLDQFNTSYIPTNEDELSIAQGRMPEKINTFEKASEYYSAFGKELTTEEYNKVAGYYTARSEVIEALDNKRKLKSHIAIFVDEFSGATTRAQQDDVLRREAEKEATVISLYNEANEVLGIERRAYDIFDVVMQMSMDEVFMNGDTAINRYRESAEYFGRKLDDETYWKNTYATGGMILYGFIDLANMIGLTDSTSESVLLRKRIGGGVVLAEGGYKDIYGREFEPGMFTWNELAAAMDQNKKLREGLSLEEIERGIFGNLEIGPYRNESAAATLFLDGVAAAVPQIAGTIVMTLAGAPEVALVGFAGSTTGSAYSDMKDNPNLTMAEKILYSSLMGGFEYVSEKIFMKQEVISANAIRRMFGIGVKDIAQETAQTTARRGLLGSIQTGWKKTTGNRVFKFFEEGIEEGLVSFASQHLTNYAERTALDREISSLQTRLNTEDIADDVASNLRSQIAGKEIEKTNIKYNYIETLDAFAIGTAAGGIQMGIVRAPSYIASKFNFKDQLALESKYEALQKRLAKETNSEKKAQIKQEMLETQDQMWRVSARDMAFLANITDEDLTQISGLNTRIRKNRRKAFDTRKNLEDARKQGNEDAVAVYEAELSALQADTKQAFEAKFNIEGKYSQNQSFLEQNLEDPETQAVIDEVGRVDPDITDYGRVSRGNSVELTGENANSVIDRIINAGKIISTKFSSREEIIRGLQNVKKIIQTVVGQGGKVFIHGTAKAFEKATGADVSRGIHIKDGNQVHLFLPALKANTPYHEAFHSAAMQIDEKQGAGTALRKLARQFAMALPNAKRYLAFVSEYLTKEQQALAEVAVTDALARKLLSQIVEQNPQAAQELVMEILADITNGDLSAEYKQGLISSLKNYVAKLFGTEFKNPTLKNVVDAIKFVTNTIEGGFGLAGMQSLADATEGLKDVPTVTTDDEAEEAQAEPTPDPAIASEVESLNESESNDNTAEEGKSAQKIVETVADMLTENGFTLVMEGKGKNKKLVLKPSKQVNLFKMKKDEIIKVLQDSGMKKEQAEKTYKNAVQFARGRRAARKESAKIAAQAKRRQGKLSTEAKNLRKKLQELKDKSKSLQEFFKKAQALIKERMKDRKTSNKFSATQLKSFFAIAGQMARTSAKKLSESDLDIIDSFLDKLATIFDKQDARKAMDDHLNLVKSMRKLQKTLLRKSRQKDFGAYRSLARIVAGIDASLIPVDQMQSFSDFVNDINNSMKRARFSKDEEGNLVVTESNLKEVKSLMAIATNFKAIEETERDANFRARATKAVEAAKKAGKSTTFAEEYTALLEKYQRSRLSPTRKKIEDTAKKLGLDVNNVEDLEIILDELAKDSAELAEDKKELILSDAIIPRVIANLEELLRDKSFRTILGLFSMENVSVPELKARLMQLDMRHLAALEYKINDYLVNSSTVGLGYLASIVRGKISLASDIKALVAKGVRSKNKSYGSFADNVPSFIRNVFKVSNVDVAKILVAIGFQDVMSSVNLHEQAHMERVTALQNKIDEITEKGGEITSDLSNAIAQIFSMANQKPEALSEAEWFMNLRDAMDSTIQEYEVEQSDIYDPETIQEFKDAREYLFGQTNNLQELLDKVRNERTDIVEIVEFLSQMHESMRPDFENFTERYLGKTLEVLENYTPFKVRKKGFDDQLDSVMEIRRQLISALSSAGNSNYTKTPGATFEREARAVGGDSILGLNFLKINESTLRQNSFIMMSLEDVLAMKYAFQTEAMQGLMPKSIKAKLSEMIDNYLVADATEVPFIFQKNIKVAGKTIRNPFEMFRVAAVINAFGGVFVQFFKQSTVMLSAFANTKTLQGKAYLIRTFGEMLALTFVGKDRDGKLKIVSDPKVKINDGRYELLRNTTLFLRDYKAGNIDPFTGRVEFDKSRLDKTRDWLQDKSMWTLTTTDKVAAISSFYAFYADFLLSEGVVNDISEINWEQEAANPNMEAIAYAENIVSKDQNVSSSRLAANVYKNKSAFVRFLVQTMLPFQSFAINTKRSITGDVGRIIDPSNAQARKDGLRGLAGTTASLFVFAYISRVMTALISEFVKGFGDDDDESNLDEILTDTKTIRESAVQTVLDAIPLPSTPAIDNKVKDFFNYYLFFNASDYDAPGLEDKDAFELFKQYGDAVTTYGSGVTDKKGPVQNAILTALSVLGPGGKFAMDLEKMLEPTLNGGTSYTTGSGRERFIRPEDRADFMLSNTLRTLLSFANLAGVGVKELDYVAKALDDMPKDRALSSEEQLAAFETILIAIGNDPEIKATIEGAESAGPGRLLSILQKQAEEDPVTLARGLSQAKFKSALKGAVGDKVTEMMFPQEYKKYSAEVRRISRRSPKEIAAVIRGKEGEMNPDDFKRYNNFLLYYIALNSEATFNNVLIELDINTVE